MTFSASIRSPASSTESSFHCESEVAEALYRLVATRYRKARSIKAITRRIPARDHNISRTTPEAGLRSWECSVWRISVSRLVWPSAEGSRPTRLTHKPPTKTIHESDEWALHSWACGNVRAG